MQIIRLRKPKSEKLVCFLLTREDGLQKVGKTNNLQFKLRNLKKHSELPLTVKSIINTKKPWVFEKLILQKYKKYVLKDKWLQLPESELKKWEAKGMICFGRNKTITRSSPWIRSILGIKKVPVKKEPYIVYKLNDVLPDHSI